MLVNGDPAPGAKLIKENLKVYPLAKADNSPKLNFVDVSGKAFNTVHAMDYTYFEEINELIQGEPNEAGKSFEKLHTGIAETTKGLNTR